MVVSYAVSLHVYGDALRAIRRAARWAFFVAHLRLQLYATVCCFIACRPFFGLNRQSNLTLYIYGRIDMKKLALLSIIASVIAISGCAKSQNTEVSSAAGQQDYPEIKVVAWSDFHSAIYEDKRSETEARGGLPVWMAAVEQAKGDGLSLLIDSGDMFQGAMPFNEAKGMGMIEMMNTVGIDVATFGNHEFDYGAGKKYPDSPRGALREAVEASQFPWVNANIATTADNKDPWPPQNLYPYVILNKGPYKIAFIGLDTTETPIATIAAHVEGIEFKNPAQTLMEYIPKIVAENPDFIIVQAHLTGLPDPLPPDGATVTDVKFDGEIAEILALPEDIKKHIGLIIAGHSHKSFIAHEGDLTIIENFNNGREFTTLTLAGDANGLHIVPGSIQKKELTHKPIEVGCGEELPPLEPIDVSGTMITPSAKGREIVQKYEKNMTNDRCEIVGCFDDPMIKNYDGEDPTGNLITDAMRTYYKQADIAVQNAGGLRIDMPKGHVYRETLNTLMPFDNYLLLVDMPAQDIKRLLKVSSTLKHGATKVAGVVYQIEQGCQNPEDINGDGKIDSWENNCLCEEIVINGKPLESNRTYKVAVSDFMFNGGDSHAGVFEHSTLIEKGPVIKSIFLDYVKNANACFTRDGLVKSDAPRIKFGSCNGKFAK